MSTLARRISVFVLAALSAACASRAVNLPVVAIAPNAAIDSTGSRIRVHMATSVEDASRRIVQALVERDILAAPHQVGHIEALLPRQAGLLGQYDIVVRAFVMPVDSGGVNVLMYAEEGIITKPDNPPVWYRITDKHDGRARATWNKLLEIGRSLGQ